MIVALPALPVVALPALPVVALLALPVAALPALPVVALPALPVVALPMLHLVALPALPNAHPMAFYIANVFFSRVSANCIGYKMFADTRCSVVYPSSHDED